MLAVARSRGGTFPMEPASSLSKRECDTGTTAFIDRFPYHRLCDKHLSELPGGICSPSEADSGTSTPSSVGFVYLSNNQLSVTNLSGNTKCSEKDYCHCLISKTMLCSDCVNDAKVWQDEQAKMYERSGIVECAYGRFPGGCKADINTKCGCGGRGIDCNFISEKDWEKFEATDFNWIGRTGLDDGQFEKKEKKDLRSVFGDNFPVRAADSFDGVDRPFKGPLPVLARTPPPTPKKQNWVSNFGAPLRRAKSISFLGRQKKVLSTISTICDAACNASRSSTSQHAKHPNPETLNKTFLKNPQMRKPFSNFRVNPDEMKPPTPMRAPEESYLDSESEEEDEEEPIVNQEDDEPESDYASIADSASTIGSEYDYEDSGEPRNGFQKGLHPTPPTFIHIGTASLATRQISPRLIQMRSSPNLKADIVDDATAKKIKERKKWGCREEVDCTKVDLNSIQAHGFWRCSFCSGRIRGI
ncbi:hypothetical protein AA313_de0200722 [Arthrobotrys entomopaga]|nr:hypothetical protein AA313_de0200722 [Arthrobotrys entomopaga]